MALNLKLLMKGEMKRVYKVTIVACFTVHPFSKFTWARPVTVWVSAMGKQECQPRQVDLPECSVWRLSEMKYHDILCVCVCVCHVCVCVCHVCVCMCVCVCVCVFPAWRSPRHQQQFVRIIAVNMHTQPLCTSKSCYRHHHHCSTV